MRHGVADGSTIAGGATLGIEVCSVTPFTSLCYHIVFLNISLYVSVWCLQTQVTISRAFSHRTTTQQMISLIARERAHP